MAAKQGDFLGRIDCPYCKGKSFQRITVDRNGKPFGFCDGKCRGQMRIGGDEEREQEFAKAYPHITAKLQELNTPPAGPAAAAPAAKTGTEETPALGQRETSPGPVPPAPKQKRRSLLAELLDNKD